jgi:RHS repeat-associated protein
MKYIFLTFLLLSFNTKANESFKDYLIQTPNIESPKRGSLQGEYSKLGLESLKLSTGSYNFSLPITFPNKRGKMLWPYNVSYSPSFGLDYTGIGWSSQLYINRHRDIGKVDYLNDDLMTPWGQLVLGSDGYYYSKNVLSKVKAEILSDEVIVYLTDGRKLIFGNFDDNHNDRIQTGQTYKWYLREVSDLVGHKSYYHFLRETLSDQTYLSKIEYGGIGEDFQHEVIFNYVDTKVPMVTYSTGRSIKRNKRLSTINVYNKESSSFIPTYHYSFTYSENGNSPAYYLESIQKIFESGEKEPAVTYDYDSASDYLTSLSWRPQTGFEAILNDYHSQFTNRNAISFQDFNGDGKLDFEIGKDYKIFLNTDSGLTEMNLEEPTGDVSSWCKFPVVFSRKARKFFRPFGNKGDAYVFDLFEWGNGSVLDVCKLNGERKSLHTFPSFWKYGLKTIFADINGDTLPDIIHLGSNYYEVAINTSSNGVISFDHPSDKIMINLPTDVSGFWVNDINGDSFADIIIKGKSSIYIHHGDASGNFSVNYTPMRFYLPSGHSNSTNIEGRSVQFIDFNKDGIKDALIQGDGVVSLYINNGVNFVQKYIPGLFLGSHVYNNIISGDISGDGNFQLLTSTYSDDKLLSLDLERTSLGLMTSFNDGRGNTFSLSYDKSNPQLGILNRKTIVTELNKTTVGEGDTKFSLSYGNITSNYLTGSFLGFNEYNSANNNKSSSRTVLSYDERNRSRVIKTESFDLDNPDFVNFLENTYEQKDFNGIEYFYKSQVNSGSKNLDGSQVSSKTTQYTLDEANLCESNTTTFTDEKFLSTSKQYSEVLSAADHLACFVSRVNLDGDNFSYYLKLDRNDSAQVTDVYKNELKVQNITYGSNGLISTVTEAGKGTTNLNYDEHFRLNQSTSPEGVITQVSVFNNIFDTEEVIDESRNSTSYINNFRFDNFGRLSKSWHNLGSYSDINPQINYEYQFATNSAPGIIKEISRFNATDSSDSLLSTYFFTTGSGAELASATRADNNFVIAGLKSIDNANFKTATHRAHSVALGVDFLNYTMEDFNFLQNIVSSETKSALGRNRTSSQNTFENLHQDFSFEESAQNGQVTIKKTENGIISLSVSNISDSFGHEKGFIDQDGNLYQYAKDSLGRITDISLPSGDVLQVSYDLNYGLVESIYRSGYGSIRYFYDPTSLVVSKKEYRNTKGHLEHSTQFYYDSITRLISKIETVFNLDGSTKNSQLFEYLYDGNYFLSSTDSSQLGRLTAIRGDKFVKELSYFPDEKQRSIEITYDNSFKYFQNFQYFDQRDLKSMSYGIIDLSTDSLVFDKTLSYTYSEDTKLLETISQDLKGFISISYKDLLEIDTLTVNGTVTSVGVDTNTRKYTSLSNSRLNRSWSFDTRNLIDQMLVSDSTRNISKNYTYSNRAFLSSLSQLDSLDTDQNLEYSYDQDGLMTLFKSNGIEKELKAVGDHWNIANEIYNLDKFGRVISKNGRDFEYGATRRISKVKEDDQLLASYFYDEDNDPIFKLYSSGEKEFYVGDAIYSNNALINPIKIEGLNYVLGYFKNEVWYDVESDHINTLIKDSSDNINLATPYGERISRDTDDHKVLDFALKGYDEEIGSVRMGHRFYDPVAKRFLTPDSYFVENFNETVRSPVEGNLFSYAGNNPVINTDPTGDCFGLCTAAAIVGGTTAITSITAWITSRAAAKLNHEVRGTSQSSYNNTKNFIDQGAFGSKGHFTKLGAPGAKLAGAGTLNDVIGFVTGKNYLDSTLGKDGKVNTPTMSKADAGLGLLMAGQQKKFELMSGMKGLSNSGKSALEGIGNTYDAASKAMDTKNMYDSVSK